MTLVASLVALSIVAITKAQSVPSISYIDQAAADADAERRRQLFVEIKENFEKGKTDDAALKEAICSLFPMTEFMTTGNPFAYVLDDMTRREISRERQIQGLENIIREMLSAVDKGEEVDNPNEVFIFLATLKNIPNYDILPILEECMKSKNGIIRNDAQKIYNSIMEKPPAQLKTATDITQANETDAASNTVVITPALSAITNTPTPEPLASTEQPSDETPPEQTKKKSSNKPLLWGSVIALLAIIGGVAMWQSKKY